MEINLNCDLGEKSSHYNGVNDNKLLKIINSINLACGYHAGNKTIINKSIKEAIKNKVSIGAHPGFKDLKNFGRKKLHLSKQMILIVELLVSLTMMKMNLFTLIEVNFWKLEK